MQDREDDIDHTRQIGRRPFRLGQDREPPAAPRHERHARSALWNGGRERARFKRTHEPGAGPGYADRNRIVARRVERAEHVAGGHDGYVVLGRAAAEQQRDAQSLGHVAISESVHCRGLRRKRLDWSTSDGKPQGGGVREAPMSSPAFEGPVQAPPGRPPGVRRGTGGEHRPARAVYGRPAFGQTRLSKSTYVKPGSNRKPYALSCFPVRGWKWR